MYTIWGALGNGLAAWPWEQPEPSLGLPSERSGLWGTQIPRGDRPAIRTLGMRQVWTMGLSRHQSSIAGSD
jgi:hypothetical protein